MYFEGATEYMDAYLAESDVIYPPEETLAWGESYGYLPEDIIRHVENLFLEIRVSSSGDLGTGGSSLLPSILILVILVVLAILPLLFKRRKK